MASALRQAKVALRKEMKAKISALTEAEKSLQSSIVTKKVLLSPEYANSKRISIFLSMNDEINTEMIVKDVLNSSRACYIPHYQGSVMRMLRLKSWDDYLSLPLTSWNIKQPDDNEEREDALDTGGLDLVFVPGLAFTSSGERLGRGKGYYDKFLSQCRDSGNHPLTMALAFAQQVCQQIPTSADDAKIDTIVFPAEQELLEASKTDA